MNKLSEQEKETIIKISCSYPTKEDAVIKAVEDTEHYIIADNYEKGV